MKNTVVILRSGSPDHVPALGLEALAKGFERLGYKTVTLDLNGDPVKEDIAALASRKEILFFLSHNLAGWDISYDQDKGKLWLCDSLGVWFVSILDTPLNKIEKLRRTGKKAILLFLDKAFIPLVKKVTPPGTIIGHFPNFVVDGCLFNNNRDTKAMAQRSIDVLFIGRVGANISFMLESKNIFKRLFANRVVKRAFHCRDKQVYDISFDILRRNWLSRIARPFHDPYSAEFLYFNWGMSNLVRTKRRMRVLDELRALRADTKVTIVTNDVVRMEKEFPQGVDILPFQKWLRIVELMGDAKIVINVQPFHVYASHERLLTAMAHGAVVASDRNQYLEERFKDGESVIFYDFNKGYLSRRLSEYLADIDRLSAIALQGKEKVLANDLATNRAPDILSIVHRMSEETEKRGTVT